MVATRSDSVISRPVAISFSPCQNASSRLTLVLCPAITIERLTTGELIDRLPCRSGADRGLVWLFPSAPLRACCAIWADHAQRDSPRREDRYRVAWRACAPCAG